MGLVSIKILTFEKHFEYMHHFEKQTIISHKKYNFPQGSWYPVSLEFLMDLWIPNVFIYNLKSFENIAVLKRLAGEYLVYLEYLVLTLNPILTGGGHKVPPFQRIVFFIQQIVA